MNRVRIKICGITNIADAQQAVELGADAIGLNFHPQSPRYVNEGTVKAILWQLPPFVVPVGVFTDVQLMCNEASWLGLRTLQWHGDPAELGKLPPRDELGPFRLIVAFRVHDQQSLADVGRWVEQAQDHGGLPAAILIDGFQEGLLGGTGIRAPWQSLADFRTPVPLILAGGLTPDNVAEAIRIVRPYAVDVASGVEASPGRKDIEKMKRFIDNARST